MDFFQQLLQTSAGLDLKMTIKRVNDTVTVSVIPEKPCEIPPILLRGTAEELDEGFFEEIRKPLQKVAGIVSNAAEVEQAADKAKEKPAPAATTKDKKETSKPKPAVKKTAPVKEKKAEPPVNPFTTGVKIIVTAVQNPAYQKVGTIIEQTPEQAAKYKGYVLAEFEAPVGKKMVPVDHIQVYSEPAYTPPYNPEDSHEEKMEKLGEGMKEAVSEAAAEKAVSGFEFGDKVIVTGPGKLRGDKGSVVNPDVDSAGEILVQFNQPIGTQHIDVKSLELAPPDEQQKERSCRICGCTQQDCRQCTEAQGFPCSWVEENLCSRCDNEIKAAIEVVNTAGSWDTIIKVPQQFDHLLDAEKVPAVWDVYKPKLVALAEAAGKFPLDADQCKAAFEAATTKGEACAIFSANYETVHASEMLTRIFVVRRQELPKE